MADPLNPRGRFAGGPIVAPARPRLANPDGRYGEGGAAPAPLLVTAPYFDLADDFDTPAGVSSMAGGAGWSIPGTPFATDTGISGLGGDGIARLNQQWAQGFALYGPAPDGFVGAHEVHINFRQGDNDAFDGVTPWLYYLHRYVGWYLDDNNHFYFQLQPASNRIQFNTVTGGSDDWRAYFNSRVGATIPAQQGSLTFKLTPDNRLRVSVDKVPLRDVSIYGAGGGYLDISSFIASGNRKGRTGFFAQNLGYPLASDIAVRTDYVIHDDAGSHRAAGHSVIGGSTGQPDISASYGTGGTIAGFIFRIFETEDPNGEPAPLAGADADGWKSITPVSDTGSAFTIRPVLPTGSWIVEYGFVRDDGHYVTEFAPCIVIGKIVLFYGQSIAEQRFGTVSTGITGLPKAAVNANKYNDPVTGYPLNYITNGADSIGYLDNLRQWHFANKVVSLSGEPCICIALGTGGDNLGSLSSGGGSWTALMDFMDDIPGVPEAVFWDHGDNRIWSPSLASTIGTYAAEWFSGIVAPMRALWGEGLQFFISSQGNFASANPPAGWSGDWEGWNAAAAALHLAQCGMCTEFGGPDPLVRHGSWHGQIDHGDASHYTAGTNGNPRLLERDADTVAKYLFGVDCHDGNGPKIIGATRGGAVVNVALDLNGAVALTTSSYTPSLSLPNKTGTVWGWFVATDSAPATPLTIGSIDVGGDGESVDITLSADPGEPVRVYHLYGPQYDDSNLVAGAYSGEPDDRPIPIQPSLDVANGRAWFVTVS